MFIMKNECVPLMPYNHCLKNTIVTAEIMGTLSKNAVKSAVKTLCSPVFVKQETEKSP